MTIEMASNNRPVRTLFLAEGDPENMSSSGSGTPASVVSTLRELGAEVITADVELYGMRRALALLSTWSPSRPRWVAKYHLNPLPYRLRSSRAIKAIKRFDPDAVLQYGGSFGAPEATKAPTFLYCDSHTLLSRGEPKSWGAALTEGQLAAAVHCQRRVYESATGIFTFSEFVRRSFLRDYRLPSERVTTVYAGPNFTLPDTDGVSSPRDVRPEQPTILFVGREFDRKGGPVLLEAFRRVRKEIPSARLVIAGPSSLDVRDPGVEHIGYLRKNDSREAARLDMAYAAADVFCLPTRHEPFGIVILEAMFHGLPVVATDVWAIPEMVLDGETGFTVPRDDVAALADRLIRLLSNPDLARRFGTAGRTRAREKFTWRLVVQKMLTSVRAALDSSAQRSR